MSHKTGKSAYLTACAVIVCAVLLIGAASGHFESKTERNVSLMADPLYRLYLVPAEDSGNWYAREFILSNVDLSPAQEPAEVAQTPPTQSEEDDPQPGEQSPEAEPPQEEPAENGENDPTENEEEGGGTPADPGQEETPGETPQEGGEEDSEPEEDPQEPSQEETPQEDPAQQETPQSGYASTPSQEDSEAEEQRRIARLPEMNARVTLLASIGIGDVEQLTVTIRSGDREYSGVPENITEGTELYRLFGPGWQFTFYDSQHQELTWAFAKGQAAEHHFTVSVRSAQPISYASMLQLIATTV